LHQLKVTKTLLIRQASYLTRNSAEVKNVQRPANFQTHLVFVLCNLTATVNKRKIDNVDNIFGSTFKRATKRRRVI